ncbi:MAG: NAD(P)-binding domain-containing protein [Ferruginibacter sp.]
MLTKQTVLIIGAEQAGREIATHLADGNFHILLCDKEYTKAAALVNEINSTGHCCDAEAMECSFDSAWEADIVILAINFDEQKEVAGIIKDVVNQKILVSTGLPSSEINVAPSSSDCQLEALQKLLPNTKVVRIFNDDSSNEAPVNDKNIPGVLIAGNDETAVDTVLQMLVSVGINAVRLGKSSSTDQ